MACITISDSRKESYVFFDKDGAINISTDKMDEVMVIKCKNGKLTTKMEKKTTADRRLEQEWLDSVERRKKRRSEKD